MTLARERRERGENKNIGEAMAFLRRRMGKRWFEGWGHGMPCRYVYPQFLLEGLLRSFCDQAASGTGSPCPMGSPSEPCAPK